MLHHGAHGNTHIFSCNISFFLVAFCVNVYKVVYQYFFKYEFQFCLHIVQWACMKGCKKWCQNSCLTIYWMNGGGITLSFKNFIGVKTWFTRIVILFLGTLFFNSSAWTSRAKLLWLCFFNYLQVLELDLKFVVVWKLKFKYLKVGEMFLQVFVFNFQTLQYWCGEHYNIIFFGWWNFFS
jgi:hypothetical protein